MIQNIEKILRQYGELFIKGLGVTLYLAAAAVVIGVFLGFILALMRMSKIKVLRIIGSTYVEIMRGLPLLLQLWAIYLLGTMAGLDKTIAVIIALGLNSGAYVAEIIRSGIQAVDIGQKEAGISLGLPSIKVMFKIIVPQGIKNILPAFGNEFVAVIKETALGSTFLVGDLMTIYKISTSNTYLVIESLIVAGLLYLFFTFTISKLVGLLEKRMKASD